MSAVRIALVLIPLLLTACSTSVPPSTTDPSSSTTAVPHQTTTSSITSNTTVPATTTTLSPVVDEAEGSGCTPGPGDLPDGEWFGYLAGTSANTVEFDLACWFVGEAAARAAQEDGAESPPPNDYHVRNLNPGIRSLNVADGALVVWYPKLGDPASEATVPYADWLLGVEGRGSIPGVWLEVEGGQVSAIQEQWVP